MIQMRNEIRPYEVISRGADTDRNGYRTQKTITATCPFCGEHVKIFVWSLCGNGKLCKCGAKFGSGGQAQKIVELPTETPPTAQERKATTSSRSAHPAGRKQ